MSRLKFQRNLTIGEEELSRWDKIHAERLVDYLKSQNKSPYSLFPLVQNASDLRVSKNGEINEVDINAGFVLNLNDSDNYVNYYYGETLDLASGFTPANGDTRYLQLTPTLVEYEIDVTATVVASSNQLTIASGSIDDLVRDLSNTDATKIKFYKDSGLVNTGTYTIINRIDSSNYIIDGSLTDETDLKVVVIGTYDLSKITVTDGLYENVLFTASLETSGSTNKLTLAEINWTSDTDFTITDYKNQYKLNLSELKTSPSFRNFIGHEIKQETRFFNTIYKKGNTSYDANSTPFTLSGTTLTLPAVNSEISVNLSGSDFTETYGIYRVEGTSANKIIDTIDIAPSKLAGLEVKLEVTGTENITFRASSTSTAGAIYTQSGDDVIVKPGNIVSFIINKNLSFVFTSIDPSTLNPLTLAASDAEARAGTETEKFVTPASLHATLQGISDFAIVFTSNPTTVTVTGDFSRKYYPFSEGSSVGLKHIQIYGTMSYSNSIIPSGTTFLTIQNSDAYPSSNIRCQIFINGDWINATLLVTGNLVVNEDTSAIATDDEFNINITYV